MEIPAAHRAEHSLLHRVARRVSLSRPVAEHSVSRVQKRSGRLVDGLGTIRLLSHHQSRVSQLALRRAGHHRGRLLRLDLAQNGIRFCLRARPWRRRHDVALPFPNPVVADGCATINATREPSYPGSFGRPLSVSYWG